jgi:GT2 family glycosyltransferase
VVRELRSLPCAAEIGPLRAGLQPGTSAALLFNSGRNGGYAFGNNLGLRLALELGVDLAVLANSDVEVAPGFDGALRRRFASEPRLGLLGARVLNPDGSLQSCGGRLDRLKTVTRAVNPSENGAAAMDYVPGCFLALRRGVIESCGFLPEEYFLYFEDVDYCQRAKKAGWLLDAEPTIEVRHREGSSSGAAVNTFRVFWCERGKVIFNWKHRPWCLPWHLAYVLLRFAAVLCLPRRRFEALPLVRGSLAGLLWCLGVRGEARP